MLSVPLVANKEDDDLNPDEESSKKLNSPTDDIWDNTKTTGEGLMMQPKLPLSCDENLLMVMICDNLKCLLYFKSPDHLKDWSLPEVNVIMLSTHTYKAHRKNFNQAS